MDSSLHTKNPKIAIIGAGLAGLTAAHRLHGASADVTVYEARQRVGGRVLSARVHGSMAELGGQSITDGGKGSHIQRLIDACNLECTSTRIRLDHYYFDGKFLSPILKKSHEETLHKHLRQLASTAKNLKEVLKTIIDEASPLYKVLSVRLAAYEGACPEKLSPIYVETLFHMLSGGISSAHPEAANVEIFTIKGGNSLLPEKLAAGLGARVRLDKTLTFVGKNSDGSFKLAFADGTNAHCDILVLAMPCSVYSDIAFEEKVLPQDKLQSIRSISYGTNSKMAIILPKIPKVSLVVNDELVSFFDAAHSVLTLYYTENTSLFSEDTIRDTYARAREMLAVGYDHFSEEVPAYAKDQNFATYTTAVGYSWPNDRYAKGSYSYIRPGQEELLTAMTEEKGETFKRLFAPIDNLYFAGEHASILLDVPGTMEAACESGERIARAIIGIISRVEGQIAGSRKM
jgi:monoamine oxidase